MAENSDAEEDEEYRSDRPDGVEGEGGEGDAADRRLSLIDLEQLTFEPIVINGETRADKSLRPTL